MTLEPTERYGAWSGKEIGAFLAETRIPLRLSLETRAGPLIVPVWFEYRNHCFWSCSPYESLLVNSLRENSRVAFDISTNEIPYRGVRGRGHASCSVAKGKSELKDLLNRYVGSDNELAEWLLNRNGDEAVIQIDVDWIKSWDFSSRMNSIEKITDRNPEAAV